jgi:hypothetical protein
MATALLPALNKFLEIYDKKVLQIRYIAAM